MVNQMDSKHFEDLWEESEKVYSKDHLPIPTLLNHLSIMVEAMKAIPVEIKDGKAMLACFSKVVFLCTCISSELGINAYEALQSAVEDAKEKLLDP
jgi:hypothetical protein